jgi:hypothetical protein
MSKFVLVLCCLATSAAAQIMPLTLEPDGGNKKASVSEQIGILKSPGRGYDKLLEEGKTIN